VNPAPVATKAFVAAMFILVLTAKPHSVALALILTTPMATGLTRILLVQWLIPSGAHSIADVVN